MRGLAYFRLCRKNQSNFVCIVCIINFMDSTSLTKLLERSGWQLRGVKGSHHIYVHPDRPGHISVPHPKKDLGIGITNKLLKQAGLK